MVKLSFYGGINEIGGNKILLEDGERRLLLDFGFPYKRHKLFYEEYLRPRGGAGLLDPLSMGLLPPLEGLYRDDLVTSGIWQRFQHVPTYRRLEQVDGVLLSHAHLDHSGHISFLKGNIPIYSTAATAFITKAIQDSGKSDFDQQVCYFSPTTRDFPTGWRQIACVAGNAAKEQRQFCLADIKPEDLSLEAMQFWSLGFWEKKTKQKELISCPLASQSGCSFTLRCFPVDHSIPGACAWGIETSSGWVVYSGDLRLHGKRTELTKRFIEQASHLRPRTLILEGTNVQREANIAEHEVYENGLKAVAESDGLVIADFSPRDIDRLLTFLQIARDTGRKLAILPRDAYLLKTMRLLWPEIPDIAEDDNLVIYQDTIASRYPSLWLRNICQEYARKIVLADDVSSAQRQFILCFSFFDLNELPSICPGAGSVYVYSSSEPHDEEQEIDFRRLHNWLRHFGLRSVGLPVEHNGQWQIPDEEKGLHASGHACGSDLLDIARQINPEVLIPVHSEHPEFYIEHLTGSGVDVILPDLGETIEI
ncbi:MAG: MBL fold metallo-hydrolase RNA specificity domain-containing protein [Chloroflexota bacterium]